MRDKKTPARDIEDPVSDHSIHFTVHICQIAKQRSLLLQLSYKIIVNVSGKTAADGQSGVTDMTDGVKTRATPSLKGKYLTSDGMKLSKVQPFHDDNFPIKI